MKKILGQLHGAFDHRNRLGIMSVLVVNDWVEYNSLKTLLELTDGNLASHLKALEAAEFLEYRKQFVGKKPQTQYRATDAGHAAFRLHLDALEAMIRSAKPL